MELLDDNSSGEKIIFKKQTNHMSLDFTSFEKSTDLTQELSPKVTRLPTREFCMVTLFPRLHSLYTILFITVRFCFLSIIEC